MKPYELEDEAENSSLTITASTAGDRPVAAVSVSGENGYATAHVEPSAVPGAALALYAASGLPEPVILENLPGKGETAVAPFVRVEPSPARTPQNLPGVMLDVDGTQVRLIRDEPLRVACALVIAMREAAPDPAEVEALATAIHRANCEVGNRCVQKPDDSDRIAARSILLGGWKRETQA